LFDLKMIEESGIDPDVLKRPLDKICRLWYVIASEAKQSHDQNMQSEIASSA
jgi:hypothetical protein